MVMIRLVLVRVSLQSFGPVPRKTLHLVQMINNNKVIKFQLKYYLFLSLKMVP